jgi:hypothetical protein
MRRRSKEEKRLEEGDEREILPDIFNGTGCETRDSEKHS